MSNKELSDDLVYCGVCGETSETGMVQCDDCDRWHHYVCVGVTDEIKNNPWSCAHCKQGAEEVENTIIGDLQKNVNSDQQGRKSSNEFCNHDEMKTQNQVSRGGDAVDGYGFDLEYELERLEEERAANLLFIRRKYELLNLAKAGTFEQGASQAIPLKNYNDKFEGKNCSCHVATGGTSSFQGVKLRADQLNARSAVPKELPIFTGMPEEWPAFISSYENSTRLCGLSNDENLLRLQQAIKGKARKCVGSLLLIPSLVPDVINTLREMFGRPEHIINSLLAKIRATSNVDARKLETLISFSLEVKNLVATMQASDLTAHLNNPLLLSELIDKLPPQMRLEWAVKARHVNNVNLTEFSSWLYELAVAAGSVVSFAPNANFDEKKKTHRVGFHEESKLNRKPPIKKENARQCVMCEEDHFVANCEHFKRLPYKNKWEFVHQNKLCRSCLKVHDLNKCKDRKECSFENCTAKHHPMLHKPDYVQQEQQNVVAIQVAKTSKVLFKILPITVYGGNSSLDIYALLDDGSGPTLVAQDVIDKLHMKGIKSELCIRWTDGSLRTEPNSEILSFKISAPGKLDNKILLRDVHSVKRLDLPSQTINVEELEDKFPHLKGLPVHSYENVVPSMIIGLNNKHATLPIKFREGKPHEPAATKTRIGWTIFGSVTNEGLGSADKVLQLHICECDNEVALNKLMIENMKSEKSINDTRTAELSTSEFKKYEKYVQRGENAFTAKLFWRSNNLTLPDNFPMAEKRLQCFEKKLMKNCDLKLRVKEIIHSMEEKRYIRKLSDLEVKQQHPRKWYLPIFTVHNPNKPHKTRIVWDAAAESNGVSLNKCLESGPDLLRPLIEVLFNFRKGKIGICGDICEMFHRIGIDGEDQHSQRFLWRDCQLDKPPNVYVLQVCSFGATCSPCIAQLAKNKNANDFQEKFPRAVKSILEHHYMDDMLDSVDTPAEAVKLAIEVSFIHKQGNFEIRNWLSNSKEVMDAVGASQGQSKFCKAAQTIDQIIEPDKVLGLWWQTRDDVFMFSTKFTKASKEMLNGIKLPTKRELLRLIMSVFDPLGFLSFYTVRIKILLQEIWRSGIEWDDTIPSEFESTWKTWLAMFNQIQDVQVPRCYFETPPSVNSVIDLHVFVDASTEAYAAVAYLRISCHDKVKVSLVGSKSKVAPLRPISVPRLELLGAVLGARYAKCIIEGHALKIRFVRFWSDSKTVLFWVRQDPRKYKQFVMFRIAEIQEITDKSQWAFVPSKLNIADKATKIKNSIEFDTISEWFSGPRFLQWSPENWPVQESSIKYDDEDNQTSSEDKNYLVGLQIETPLIGIDPSRFSKWERLWRSTAYLKHFIENSKIKRKNTKFDLDVPCNSKLTSEELLWSENYLYRLAQCDEYPNEIKGLESDPSSVVPKKSPLRKLSPYLDNNKILRVRGRIDNAQTHFNVKNPIIMPKKHIITNLIVNWYHRKYHHIHHETVLNEIAQKFYVPSLRRTLRSIRHACQICKNLSVQPMIPEMGQLPEARLSSFTRPFSYVGIDFFGPFLVVLGRRTEKRYGVLFTCLTSRAVHIEVAYSLTMNSCVTAIRNFICRRGTPIHIYSDNGTNFVASEKELRDAYEQLNTESLQEKFVSSETKWSFIPPASPHMGGAWERMIRTAKNVLYKIVTPSTKLTDEKLNNVLVEVECILNSRPLTYLSLESAAQEAITPNHILLGSSSGLKPPGKFETTDQYVKSSWRHSQYLAQCFWQRWVKEVLPLLTRRSKWHDKIKPIEKGDIVVIVDPNLPRYTWPKGTIIDTVTAKDGQVRSAFVQTISGIYHRPVTKIAILDVKREGSDGVANKGIYSNGRHTGGGNVGNPCRLPYKST